MKLLKLIYNPVSGNSDFKKSLDYCIERFQSLGYLINLYRTEKNSPLKKAFFDIKDLNYDAIITAGGDGTVNEIINQMKDYDLDIPLGIVPAGTSNDLAVHLDISRNLNEALDVIAENTPRSLDVGKIKKIKTFIL